METAKAKEKETRTDLPAGASRRIALVTNFNIYEKAGAAMQVALRLAAYPARSWRRPSTGTRSCA